MGRAPHAEQYSRFFFILMICKKCGCEGIFRTEQKGVHLVAYCGRCDAYIQNLPTEAPKFYFGKYKDKYVSDVDDLGYLEWYLRDIKKITSRMKSAIEEQVRKLKLLMA